MGISTRKSFRGSVVFSMFSAHDPLLQANALRPERQGPKSF